MSKNPSILLARRAVLIGGAAAAFSAPWPTLAQQAWHKVNAYGVEFEVPAGWKRIELKQPKEDHDEVMFAENAKNFAAGPWFSIFPLNDDLLDPDLKEQQTTIDGRAAKMTDRLTRSDDPPPRRRQIVVYFNDPRAAAFLFDANSEQWDIWGPVLDRILASIKLAKH